MRHIGLIHFLLLFFITTAYQLPAQPVSLNLIDYKLLDYDYEYVPENLLNGRTAVFVSVRNHSSNERGDWKPFAQKAHDYFYRIGIDPVSYYYIDDVMAGKDVTSAIINDLNKRMIKNLILLDKNTNSNGDFFTVIMTSFTGKEQLLEHGQKAWYNQNDEFDKILINLYQSVGRKNMDKKNFLVLERPEFYFDTQIIRGKRFERYQSDLKLDKLAVPEFLQEEIPENYTENEINEYVAESLAEKNEKMQQYNEDMKAIMNTYPYEYGIIDISNKSRDQLINEGFQYVLLYVHSAGISVKQLLDYDIDPAETDYVSIKSINNKEVTIETIPVNTSVYKFYVKHLYTGDIFLGSKWDADTSWQSALKNYITGMKIELDINQ